MHGFFIDGETVREFRDWAYAKGYARAGANPLRFMQNYARRHGIAVGVCASDTVIAFETISGKLTRRTYRPEEVQIDWPGKHK